MENVSQTALTSLVLPIVISIATTVLTNWVIAKFQKPKIKVAVLGTRKESEPRKLIVTLSIKNEGDASDTLEVAHVFLSKVDRDFSNYSMDLRGNGVWSFSKPVFCKPDSVEAIELVFWTQWDNVPQRIELQFAKSGLRTILIEENAQVMALFKGSAVASSLAILHGLTNKETKLIPQWF